MLKSIGATTEPLVTPPVRVMWDDKEVESSAEKCDMIEMSSTSHVRS